MNTRRLFLKYCSGMNSKLPELPPKSRNKPEQHLGLKFSDWKDYERELSLNDLAVGLNQFCTLDIVLIIL